jgi:hypothetical protein
VAAYRARSEERNAAVRAALEPLAPGERPWPLVAASLVAVVLCLITLIMFLTGTRLGGSKPPAAEVIVYCALMLTCAIGCWTLRYWAVLGFQTLLAIGILGVALALIRVNSLIWALVCVVVIGAGGYLFWKLVRVLSRLQLPTPPGR